MEDSEYAKIGKNIVDLLNLKIKKNGRIDTNWGDKTFIGIGKCIEQILNGNLPKDEKID